MISIERESEFSFVSDCKEKTAHFFSLMEGIWLFDTDGDKAALSRIS